MKQLDLGCGTAGAQQAHAVDGYEYYGVDLVKSDNPNIKAADLAINPIPFDSDTFDLVTAHDFMEHIPHFLYLPIMHQDGKLKIFRRNSMIELWNEIYRVLKDGGEFRFRSPIAGTGGFYRDPTHVYPWTHDGLHYFTGDYYGFHDDYGHTSKFELMLAVEENGMVLDATVKARKPAEPPYELGAVR